MSIGSCDCCNRQNVPVSFSAWDQNNVGCDTTACYLCCGDTDPDPYGEMDEHSVAGSSVPGGDGFLSGASFCTASLAGAK